MDHDTFDEERRSGSRWIVIAAVIVGISLFIAGFALTLFFLQDDASAGIDGTDSVDVHSNGVTDRTAEGFLLVVGLTLSMVGVVVATVVPAFAFIRHVNRDA